LAVDEELEQAQGLLAAGDVPGLIRHLRAAGETLPLGEMARLLAGAARLAGFDDLARAAAAVGGVRDGFRAQDAQALYDLGCACTGRGVPGLAVRPLALALELVPDSVPALGEFVSALEHDGQHARVLTMS
jgi:hypothetical protein